MTDMTNPAGCTECGTYPCDDHDTTTDPTPHPRWPQPITSLITNPPPAGEVVVLAGLISAFERRINKNGEPWAIGTVQDLGAAIPVLFAPDDYRRWGAVLVEGTPLVITGRVSQHEGTVAVAQPTVAVAALPDVEDRASLDDAAFYSAVLDRVGFHDGAETTADGSADNDLAHGRARAVLAFLDDITHHQQPAPPPTVPPSGFTAHTCVSVHCGGCHTDYGDTEDGVGTVHFDTIEAAARAVAGDGWQVSTTGVRCDTCTARQTCAATGHVWGRWLDCRCGCRDGVPGITSHTRAWRARWCDRCDGYEQHDPA